MPRKPWLMCKGLQYRMQRPKGYHQSGRHCSLLLVILGLHLARMVLSSMDERSGQFRMSLP